MKNSLLLLLVVSLVSDSLLRGMENPQKENHAIAHIYFALAKAINSVENDAGKLKQLIIIKELLFPQSLDRNYLITAHVRAAFIGTIEVKCCNTNICFKDKADVYTSLVGFLGLHPGTAAEIALRNDFNSAVALLQKHS